MLKQSWKPIAGAAIFLCVFFFALRRDNYGGAAVALLLAMLILGYEIREAVQRRDASRGLPQSE